LKNQAQRLADSIAPGGELYKKFTEFTSAAFDEGAKEQLNKTYETPTPQSKA
jgi:hypothetical protein